MATIDERIVAISFENTKFEANVATTMTTLTKLDGALKNVGGNATGLSKIEAESSKVTLSGPMSALDKLKSKLGSSGQGAAEGMSQIESAGNKVTLAGPNQAVDKLQGKMGQLSAGSTFTDIEKASEQVTLSGLTSAIQKAGDTFTFLEHIAANALGGITTNAAMKGASFAKSFALGPVTQGFQEYGTNLGSIQTILANTQDSGGNLKTVNSALDELNTYSDKTIYNFSEMAKNIGTFTAAGVQLKPATSAIKGIANLAALSGSNSQQASTAMYQLSQAIASGKVGLQDWNSVVNAGMGGSVFQKSLMRTAENMGALKKGAVDIDKATGKATVNGQSFRDSIMAKPGEKSWLTSDVLTQTLSQMTGDMTDAQLAAKGFDKAQIAAIQRQAKTAQNAATQVKTLPQVFDVARETIGSGWSATFRNIFGDFSESKKTFTELSQTINGFINTNSDARNKVLKSWHDLGGRTVLIDGIKQAFKDLIAIIKPIHDAFREIFPPKTGKDLFAMTKGFQSLMERLKPGPETVANLKRTFAGIFAVFHIAMKVIGGLIGVFLDLFGIVGGKGGGAFLNITGSIGDFLVSIDAALTKGGLLNSFFNGLSSVVKKPIELIGKLASAFTSLFGGDVAKPLTNAKGEIVGFTTALTPLEKIVWRVKTAWETLLDKFSGIRAALEPFFSAFVEKLRGLGDILKKVFDDLNYDDIMSGLQTGLIAGILITLKKALGIDVAKKLGNPFEGINKVLGGFTGQMEAMQSKLHAEALLAIAGAVAVLAAGLFVLSKIPADQLSKALTATAIGLGELMGAMKLMTAGMGKMGILQLPVIAAGMIGLALAVVILAGAMKIFATMSWEEISRGMAGVAGSLAGIAAGMALMGGPISLAAQAAGLILIGFALNLIAASMKVFSTMSWEDMIKGLFGVVEAIGGIGLAMGLMPPNLPITAAGLILVGFALNGIAAAVLAFGSIDMIKLLTGLGGMAGALLIIAAAVLAFPPTMPLTAAGLVLMGIALTTMAAAIGAMGALKPETMVKGLLGITGALIALAGGLSLMTTTVPGAVALLAAAAALAVLAPVIGYLGTLKTETIIKGLVTMAAAIIVIGLASTVAAPGLIELGIALIPLGLGMLVVAGAVYLFAKAISILGETGPKAIAAIIVALTAFVAALPKIVISFIKGILDIVDQLTVLAPKVFTALGIILDKIIQFVIAKAPSLAMAVGTLVDAFLQVLLVNTPKLIAAGFKLLSDFMTGIQQNIGSVTNKATTIIVNFLNALTANTPRLVAAGVSFIVAILNGIAANIGRIVTAAYNIIVSFMNGIANNAWRIAGAAANILINFVTGVANALWRITSAGVNIILALLEGLGSKGERIVKTAVRVVTDFLEACAQAMLDLTNKISRIIVNFLNGLAESIRTNGPQIRQAGWNVADAIIDGMAGGLGELKHKVTDKIGNVADDMKDKVFHKFGIGSPSKVFAGIGRNVMLGLGVGISRNSDHVVRTMGVATDDILTTAQSTLGKVPNILDGVVDSQPTITPVLDLTDVHKEAAKMPDLGANVVPITAAASYGQAASISLAQQAALEEAAKAAPAGQGPTLHFEQKNYSPEALSDIDIYRKTNNLLSIAKSELGIANPL